MILNSMDRMIGVKMKIEKLSIPWTMQLKENKNALIQPLYHCPTGYSTAHWKQMLNIDISTPQKIETFPPLEKYYSHTEISNLYLVFVSF